MQISFLNSSKITSVKGNTDFFIKLPYQRILEIDGKKILLIHGHTHRVKSGLTKLVNHCKQLKVDICIYGHTHIQNITTIDNIIFLNPGALKNGYYAIYNKGEIELKRWFDWKTK